MRIDRLSLAEAEAQTALVDLLLAHLEKVYVTAGEPGVMSAVRDIFGRMDPVELRSLAYGLDLIPEPTAEGEGAGPRHDRSDDEG